MSSSTIGDHVELQRGTTYKSALLDQPGPVLLGLGTIERDGGFRPDKLKTYGGSSPEKLLLFPGDLYVSLKDVTQSGDLLGAIARVPDYVAVGRLTQDTVKICFKSDIPKNYFYWLLRSPQYRQYCRSHATGTTNLGLSRDDFFAFEIPELNDEREILTNQLEKIERKITLNRQTNQTLEQIAQAIFKSWFVDFDPVRAKIAAREAFIQQHPEVTAEAIRAAAGTEGDTLAHAGAKTCELAAMCAISGKSEEQLNELDADTLQQLKTTAALFPDELAESEEVPVGWLRAQLSDYVTFQNGYAFKSKDWKDDGIPVVKIGSVKPGLVDLSNVSYVSSETVIDLERFRLQPGDLLVGMSGYPGETGLVPITEKSPYLNQRVGRIRAIDRRDEYYSWIYCLLRDPKFKKYAESRSHGSAQANVSGNALVEYEVTFPGRDLLAAFNDLIKPMIMEYLTLISESEKLREIRDELLPRLLSGQLDA